MSGFNDDPFGDPAIDNPFSDNSAQQAPRNVNTQFDNAFGNSTSTAAAYDRMEPAIMQPTQEPPVYTKSSQQTIQNSEPKTVINTEELQRRQEELERKEQELNRREEEMRHSTYNVRRHNWPPLPEQCCFQPCFYQDIQVDIRLEFQSIVRNLYYLWIFHGAVMLANILGGFILWNYSIIGLGILYTLLFTPFSYICWFRPAYKAFRSDSSFNFMVFFFIFFIQFVVTAVQAVGFDGSGTIGLMLAIKTFSSNTLSIIRGILALIIAAGFCLCACADLFLISKIHRIYRSSGASMAKAQQEFTTEIFKNQHVRNAATNVAAAAVQSQFERNNDPSRY